MRADDACEPETPEGCVRVQFYLNGQWRTLLPDSFDKFNEKLKDQLTETVQENVSYKTSASYTDDEGVKHLCGSEFFEVGSEDGELYLHVQKNIGFAIGLIFTAKELQKIADDIAKVLKAYGRL